MSGTLQGGGQLERGINSDELDQSCSHPPRSTVDADGQNSLATRGTFLSSESSIAVSAPTILNRTPRTQGLIRFPSTERSFG